MIDWLATALFWCLCFWLTQDALRHVRKIRKLRRELAEALNALADRQQQLDERAAMLLEREQIMDAMFGALADARAGLIATVERYNECIDNDTDDKEEDS